MLSRFRSSHGIGQSLLLLLVTLLYAPVPGGLARRDNQPYQVDQNLLLLQCEMMFCSSGDRSAFTCNHKNCHKRLATHIRLGSCPAPTSLPPAATTTTTTTTTTANTPPWHLKTMAAAQLCRTLCTGDSGCPAAEKCCQLGCGHSCLPAVGLAAISLVELPAIPQNVTVAGLHPMQPRSAEITFTLPTVLMGYADSLLMVEAREHAGWAFRPRRLGHWHEWHYAHTMTARVGRSTRHTVSVENLRPGRWYQFRLATMGVNGTRGYSAASAEFQLRERPRNANPPRNFVADIAPRSQRHNDSLYARVSWRPPKSDYPVEKYRLTWERPLPMGTAGAGSFGLDAMPAVVSVSQGEAIVTEPVRYYEFWDLKPNAEYSLQLQALTSFGRRRLKSPPTHLTLNTAEPKAQQVVVVHHQQVHLQQHQQQQRIHRAGPPHIHVRLLPTRRSPLVARIHWSRDYAGSPIDLYRIVSASAASTTGNNAIEHNETAATTNQTTSRAGAAARSTVVAGGVQWQWLETRPVRPAQLQLDFGGLRYSQRYAVRLRLAGSAAGNRPAALAHWDQKVFATPSCPEYRLKHPRVQCP